MIKFEKVSRFADTDFNLPVRKTANSAGYDFEVAEDICIPPWPNQLMAIAKSTPEPKEPYTLSEVAALVKQVKAKPSLVSTGVKCHLEPGYYLELSVRSSTPLKHWLILANGVGIIDADYCDNPDNEGEIFFQIINMSPFNIYLKKGDIIGQGIIKKYYLTDNDVANEVERVGGFGSTTKADSSPERGQRFKLNLCEDALDLRNFGDNFTEQLNNFHKSIYEQLGMGVNV